MTKLSEEMMAAERMGAEIDKPEGARYVRASDTLWIKISQVVAQLEAGLDWSDETKELIESFRRPR